MGVDWKHFEHKVKDVDMLSSDEETECYFELVPDFIAETGYLPMECRECYKALIFRSYSVDNERKFQQMLDSLPISIHGKYNDGVVVFYFKVKASMFAFLGVLREHMNQYYVEGRIQWRVSGRYWQDDYPHFFNSAKELKAIQSDTEITMKEWLTESCVKGKRSPN